MTAMALRLTKIDTNAPVRAFFAPGAAAIAATSSRALGSPWLEAPFAGLFHAPSIGP
jgi:hypothetical protein